MPDPSLFAPALLDSLAVLLALGAAWTDLRRGMIPNRLTYPALCLALVLAPILGGWAGLQQALVCGGAVFVIMFVCFLAGQVGGGDVKLVTALAMLIRYPEIVAAMFYTILFALLFLLAKLIWTGEAEAMLKEGWANLMGVLYRVPPRWDEQMTTHRVLHGSFPMGLAIAAGTLLVVVQRWSGVENIFEAMLRRMGGT